MLLDSEHNEYRVLQPAYTAGWKAAGFETISRTRAREGERMGRPKAQVPQPVTARSWVTDDFAKHGFYAIEQGERVGSYGKRGRSDRCGSTAGLAGQ